MKEKFDNGRMEKKHPDPEALAAFVSGFLGEEERERIKAHLTSCEDCRLVVKEANKFNTGMGSGNGEETVH